MQGSVSIEGDLDQATDPSPLHQTPPSLPQLALHCHPTSQCLANRKWRVMPERLWNKFTILTLQSVSLQTQPVHANPLLQRQSCWSQAARNMSPCIHPALLPIKWQSANLTTIGQSKANWTQSWGHSKDISASKERVFHTDNTKCVNQGWLPNITPGHLKTNPSPTHNNN